MPVSGNKITIELEAYDKASPALEKAKKALNGLEDQVERTNEAIKRSNTGGNLFQTYNDFSVAIGDVFSILQRGAQIWNQAATEVTAYADQVQKLSVITGQSMEDASRQIQMADDLRVSYEALSIALRTASKKGIDTTTEGLIRLGEEYKKLPAGIERTKFLMDKFGRSGLEMDKILRATAETIRDLEASTPEGLITDAEDKRRLDEYNVALGDLQDSLNALKQQIVLEVAPSLTELFQFFNDANANTAADFINKVFEGTPIESAAHRAERLKEEIKNAGDQGLQTADDLGELEDPIKAAEEAAKKLSSALQGTLNNMFSINSQREKFADSLKSNEERATDLAEKRTRIEYELFLARQDQQNQMDELVQKMKEAEDADTKRALARKINYESNKFLQDEEVKFYQQLADIDKQIAENSEDRAKIEADNAEAQKKMIFDLTQQRLQATGEVIDAGEFEYLQKLAVDMGLVTQADADRALQASRTATENVANFEKERGGLQDVNKELAIFASYDGAQIGLTINVDTSQLTAAMSSLAGMGGTVNPSGYTPINYSSSFSPGQGSPMYVPAGSRDNGGQGMAGTPYLIGTGAQPELFVPQTNGTFTPANKIGNTYNIVINNPKREAAEYSIRAALKNLSFLGVTEQR